jgi:hypothetical protein
MNVNVSEFREVAGSLDHFQNMFFTLVYFFHTCLPVTVSSRQSYIDVRVVKKVGVNMPINKV